ncbi:MAG: type II CAAX endopeptidase family protein [Bacteroidota bacterium]
MNRIKLKITPLIQHPITKIILSTVAILIAVVSVKELITKPLIALFTESKTVSMTIVSIVGTMVMIVSYYFLNRYYERIPFRDFSKKNFFRDFFGGFLLGFSMVSFTVLMLYLMGYYQIVERLSFVKFLPTLTFIFGAAVLEEIVFRGLLFRILESWKGRTWALIISPLLFQLPHAMNPHWGILPTVMATVFGLTICLMYIHTRTLWLPISFHFGWNLVQPVFGTTLSGIDSFDSLYKPVLKGPAYLTGGLFGLETSIFSIITLTGVCIFFYWKMSTRRRA